MLIKTVALVFSWTVLFGTPLCCCAQAPRAAKASTQKESCGHCPAKESSHSEKHHSSGKTSSLPIGNECGCSHVTQDASAESGTVTIAAPSSPDVWNSLLPAAVLAPSLKHEVASVFDRGPPPDRLNVPLYLFVLHLAL